MKLIFQRQHISIKRFNDVELPDFTVLTGLNGAGKSHLLEAIETRAVIIEGEEQAKVVKFDYLNFFLDNESAYNARQIIDEKATAWNLFQNTIKPEITNIKNNLGESYNYLLDISQKSELNFFSLESVIEDPEILNQYKAYKKNIKRLFNRENFKNNREAQSIFPIVFNMQKSLDEIEKSEFDNVFKPYQLKNDFLPSQLGKVIWDYYLKYRNNEINEFENEKHGKNYAVLSEEDFEKIHGPKPWEIINRILEGFGTIEYRLPSPEGSDYYSDFQFKLEKLGDELKIDFSSLSSGEKVLMALVASIYKASSDHQFPDVLLLDEIDASLHPSMINNLLKTINEIFLENGTKVIMVTHSATTVALSPDESVFIVAKNGLDRIQKKTKNEALSILTEGYATLDEGLKIFDEIGKHDISIISEGRNADLIKKLLDLYEIKDVDVVSGVEGNSGSDQLKTIFKFLSLIKHSKKVIIVWDPDVKFSLVEENDTIPFILPENKSNTIASKGIENLFDMSLFTDFTTKITDSLGREILNFDQNRKKDFAEYILKRNNKADFILFEPLIEKIKTLSK